MTSNWPTYHGEASLQGISSTSILPPLTIGWRFKIGAPVTQPPTIYNGAIYAVSSRGELIALGLDGVKRWTASLPQTSQQESFSTPPLCVENIVLAGTDKGALYAFEAATGSQKWKTKIGEDLYGALNWLEPEGSNSVSVLALSRNTGSLLRLDLATGRMIWSSKPAGRSDCSPAVGHGIIVFGACDSALHFISVSTGTTLAKTEFTEHGPMAVGTALEGIRAYTGARDGSVFCVNTTTFTPLWTRQVASNEIFTTPAVTPNRILAGSSDGFMYCLNREDGAKVWSTLTPGNPTSPVVAGNTVIVTSDGLLSLLNLEDGKTLWSDKPCDVLTSPAISANKIIVGTDDGYIILYQPK